MTDASGTKKILVADDDPDVVLYFTRLLEEHGYLVVTARTVDAAIQTARAEKPDLICLDIMMSKKSGLAGYSEIRLDPALRRIPVLIISAFGHPLDFRGDRFRNLVANQDVPAPEGFLEKPVEPEALAAAVRAIIGPGA